MIQCSPVGHSVAVSIAIHTRPMEVDPADDYVVLATTREELDEDTLVDAMEQRLGTPIVPLIVRSPKWAAGEDAPPVHAVVGMRHPSPVFCNICANAHSSVADVHGSEEMAMYRFFARYHPPSLEALYDMYTYLSMYSEWAHQLYLRDFFRQHYASTLGAAMKAINAMSDAELMDTSNLLLAARTQQVMGLKDPDRGKVYCSWSFLPASESPTTVSLYYTPSASRTMDGLTRVSGTKSKVIEFPWAATRIVLNRRVPWRSNKVGSKVVDATR